MFVHCCHCRSCQRQTGSAFAINALVETTAVELLSGEVEAVLTPSPSGKGQSIVRCSACRVALWSHYLGLGEAVSFVRVGTLDEPSAISPDIHIYVDSKQPWVTLPPGVPAVAEYYSRRQVWSEASQARLRALQSA